MSQQYVYPRPPPSPTARVNGASHSAGPSSRTYGPAGAVHGDPHVEGNRPVSVHLPSISTAFLNEPGLLASQVSTPVSGSHLSPHFSYNILDRTPGGLQQGPAESICTSPQTPVMEPYNPQRWSARGQVSGSQMVFQQRYATTPATPSQVTGMEGTSNRLCPLSVEKQKTSLAMPTASPPRTKLIPLTLAAMPSPPPPYTQALPLSNPTFRAAVASSMPEGSTFNASPMTDSPLAQSPQMQSSPAFPPPPAQSSRFRDRSASGHGQRSLFSLSNLRGKQPATQEPQQPQFSSSFLMSSSTNARPPAARRAASTGHMQPSTAILSPSRALGVKSPDNGWQPGMALPGPPPGLPANGVRSQSLNRPIGCCEPGLSERPVDATRSRRTIVAPTLGPVPPTPADWADRDDNISGREPCPPAQQFPQGQVEFLPLRNDRSANRGTSLSRRPATRDASVQGIRERRSQSRAAMSTSEEDSKPANLVFSPDCGAISQRREHARTASSYAGPSSASSPLAQPPLSASKIANTILTPPYTPAVGRQGPPSANKVISKVSENAASDRPVSHILHTPNDDTAMQAPLSPTRPSSSGSAKAPQKLDVFALQAIERHRAFIEKEIAAATDEERIELFANFVVHESRVRRDRYTTAYNAMAGEILDLTRDMWRSYNARSGRRAITPSTSSSSIDPSVAAWATDGHPRSASSLGEFTPATDTASDLEDGGDREARQWADSFKPSLSPIPSMAVSTIPDEDSSRGRQPSRWWEQSASGAGSIGRPDRMEKTRRETKYMGINPATLQSDEEAHPETMSAASAMVHGHGPGGYPQEKGDLHETADLETPMQTPHRLGERKTSTPGVEALDVSRLVTLPPPYPRHYPAVNNSHPLLSELRSEHRLLADHTEAQKIKDAYLEQEYGLVREQSDLAKQRKAKMRADIQGRIAGRAMSYAEAAKVEADFDAEEVEIGKATARANFNVFESSVSHPLNSLLTDRLQKAENGLRRVQAELDSGVHATDPNRAQEEGDEHPECLEKLTLFKWMFEAREHLHKEMFDLHAMRSDKYSEVILTPYRLAKAQAKIDEAATFFQKDSKERQIAYVRDCLKRFEELQMVMEKHVSCGVEDQLSAFWDIAPGLLEVLNQIPSCIECFDVQIPVQEYEENPSYQDHPLQYLYSLLNHAEKSAYQFIESQTNLLCLLHEVRTATTKTRLRLLEIERGAASPNETEIRDEMVQARREAEEHLTLELKEKVGEVERQWQEALGFGLKEVKQRVSIFLEETGGMEEGLDE